MKKKRMTIVVLIAAVALFSIIYFSSHTPTQDITEDDSVPTLRIGYLPLVDHLPLMVADGKDMFEGVNVEPVKFTSWPALVEAMASGNLDGIHVINNLGVKMVLNGFEGKAVVLSHRGSIGLATKEGVNSAEDLRGKTIAVPTRFSPHYMMLHNYMASHGMEVDKDYYVLDVSPPDFVSTMASGAVEGFIGSEPFPTIAERKGVAKTFRLWDEMMIEGSNGLDCVVLFSDELLASESDAIQAYVDGIVQAGEFIEAFPLQAGQVSSPYLLNQKPDLIVATLDEPMQRSEFDDLMPRVDEYEALQDYAYEIGLLPDKIDLHAFVDDSYARKAYEKIGKSLA